MEKIVQSVIHFLKKYPKYNTVAYPVSVLPYSKDQIKESIIEYAKRPNISPEEKFFIKRYYVLLANFIEDSDAEFMNEMSDKISGHDINEDIHKMAEWFKKLQETEDFKRYSQIEKNISSEHQELEKELESIGLGIPA